jgi:hypothetical protein
MGRLSFTSPGPITHYERYVYKNGHVNYTWGNDRGSDQNPVDPEIDP